MIDATGLAAAGYIYNGGFRAGWGKWIRGEEQRKLYHIHFIEAKIPSHLPQIDCFCPVVQFTGKDGEVFNVEYLPRMDSTVEKVEEFYARAFVVFECDPES